MGLLFITNMDVETSPCVGVGSVSKGTGEETFFTEFTWALISKDHYYIVVERVHVVGWSGHYPWDGYLLDVQG